MPENRGLDLLIRNLAWAFGMCRVFVSDLSSQPTPPSFQHQAIDRETERSQARIGISAVALLTQADCNSHSTFRSRGAAASEVAKLHFSIGIIREPSIKSRPTRSSRKINSKSAMGTDGFTCGALAVPQLATHPLSVDTPEQAGIRPRYQGWSKPPIIGSKSQGGERHTHDRTRRYWLTGINLAT